MNSMDYDKDQAAVEDLDNNIVCKLKSLKSEHGALFLTVVKRAFCPLYGMLYLSYFFPSNFIHCKGCHCYDIVTSRKVPFVLDLARLPSHACCEELLNESCICLSNIILKSL